MEIVKTNPDLNLESTKTELQKFNLQVLNTEPKPEELKLNIHANNAKYIPVGIIERKLDEIFLAWQTDNFRWTVIANEIVGVLTLKVFHPVLLTWITYEGTAATQIQIDSSLKDQLGNPVYKDGKKQRDPNFNITQIERKITNTLQKDFPHLKSECLKNAAKHLGKAFGRDLNRDETGDYAPVDQNGLLDNEIFAEIKAKIKSQKTVEDLKDYWNIIESEYKTPEISNLFTSQKAKITKK